MARRARDFSWTRRFPPLRQGKPAKIVGALAAVIRYDHLHEWAHPQGRAPVGGPSAARGTTGQFRKPAIPRSPRPIEDAVDIRPYASPLHNSEKIYVAGGLFLGNRIRNCHRGGNAPQELKFFLDQIHKEVFLITASAGTSNPDVGFALP